MRRKLRTWLWTTFFEFLFFWTCWNALDALLGI